MDRILTYCSIGDDYKFKWQQKQDGKLWENRALVSVELPDPDLKKAYERFAFAVQAIFGFRGTALEVVPNIHITAISMERKDKFGVDMRLVKMNASIYLSSICAEAKISTPKVYEDFSDVLITGITFSRLLDDLERECFKYIDGCRAQQVLNFEEATKMAEEAKERAE